MQFVALTPEPSDPDRDTAVPRLRGRFETAAFEAEYATGDKEKDERSARRNVVARIAIILVGAFVTLAGLAMLVLPGPGIVLFLVGLGILAQELPWAERLLSYAQRKAKLDQVKEQPVWVRVTLVVASVGAIGASAVWFLKR